MRFDEVAPRGRRSSIDDGAGLGRPGSTSIGSFSISVARRYDAAPVRPPPTVAVHRTRTTRTATVSNCPAGCWLILGEGFNDGWEADAGSAEPRRPTADLRRLQWLVAAPFGVARHRHDDVGAAADDVDRDGSGRTRGAGLCGADLMRQDASRGSRLRKLRSPHWPPQPWTAGERSSSRRRPCRAGLRSPSRRSTPLLAAIVGVVHRARSAAR